MLENLEQDCRLEIVALRPIDTSKIDINKLKRRIYWNNFHESFVVIAVRDNWKLYKDGQLQASIKGFGNFINYMKHVTVMTVDSWRITPEIFQMYR